MAKAKAKTEKLAKQVNQKDANDRTAEPILTVEGKVETAPAPKKKMSVEEAQAIVDRYSGINGAFVPDELKQAKQVLKAKASE